MLLPTTIEDHPADHGDTIAFAEPEQCGHIEQERLGRHVQATSNGTTLIVRPSDVNKERPGIEEVSENIELHEQLLFLLRWRCSRGLGQSSVPWWLFLGHCANGEWRRGEERRGEEIIFCTYSFPWR
jgi:hypothetical protein